MEYLIITRILKLPCHLNIKNKLINIDLKIENLLATNLSIYDNQNCFWIQKKPSLIFHVF